MGSIRGRAAGSGRAGAKVHARRAAARHFVRRLRRVVAAGLAPLVAVGASLVPVVATVSGAAAISVVAGAVAAVPARASSGSVLVLLQNGETTAPETAIATAAGFTVTQVTPAAWAEMTAAQFQAYSALVIGDPSSGGACSTLTPTTATSGTDALGTTWQSAVTGKVAVLGTAPALSGSSGATSLVSDAISYAATQPSSGGVTGLYESLNCEFSTSATGTAVPLLNGVEGTGTAGGLAVTGQALDLRGREQRGRGEQAGGLRGVAVRRPGPSALGSARGRRRPARCGRPSAPGPRITPRSPTTRPPRPRRTADFTASDGVTGQPYVLLGGRCSAATQALAPTEGGEVPEATTAGGTNAAAPGVQQATAGDPVNTENGDFTQSSTDLSVPGFGPALDFTRTYDSTTAAEQTQAAAPGPMGYGWTDNLATSLTTGQPTPGDIYALDGLGTDTGNGGLAANGALNNPVSTYQNGGNTYIADTLGNRIEEVAGASGTQWGISMTAGHVYTIAGGDTGTVGASANGTAMASSLLDQPGGVTMDSAGNLYIADSVNNRILEIPVTAGLQRGISMTADDVYTIAGSAAGTSGINGDGGAATGAFLNQPQEVVTDGTGANPALEIADSGNNRIQYVFENGGTDWEAATYTANDIYTIAGSSTGVSGSGGNNTKANSGAFLDQPTGLCRSAAGDLYIADELNDQIREVPAASETAWGGQAMTGSRIYSVAGVAGTTGLATNGAAAGSADLEFPFGIACPGPAPA